MVRAPRGSARGAKAAGADVAHVRESAACNGMLSGMEATISAWVEDDYLNLSQVLALVGDNECVWLLGDLHA